MLAKITKKFEGGFSIMEVPISLFVIAVVLIIYGAASNTVTLNRDSRHKDIAHYIAVNKIEELRNLGYNGIPTSGTFTHSDLSKLPNSTATLTSTDFNADTKQVEVVITWAEPGAKNLRRVSLITLVNKYGL